MQALHYQNNSAGYLVIEPSDQSMSEPIIYRLSLSFRECLIGFQRVIDNDKFCTSSNRSATYRN